MVDLGSGESWRRLNDHPSTKADLSIVPIVEGEVLEMRLRGTVAGEICCGIGWDCDQSGWEDSLLLSAD